MQGQLLGTVVGTLAGSQNAPASNDDGGYGSIPEILLKVRSHTLCSLRSYCSAPERSVQHTENGLAVHHNLPYI